MRKTAAFLTASLIAVLLLIQLVPYGHNHTNPPVLAEPTWSDAQTRAVAVRFCYDCHSNQTNWYWYTDVAPVSWLVQNHVDSGRRELNFSEWGSTREPGEIVESVQEGSMPPWTYLLPRLNARLQADERNAFIRGLIATFGSGEGGRR